PFARGAGGEICAGDRWKGEIHVGRASDRGIHGYRQARRQGRTGIRRSAAHGAEAGRWGGVLAVVGKRRFVAGMALPLFQPSEKSARTMARKSAWVRVGCQLARVVTPMRRRPSSRRKGRGTINPERIS